jgi:hypothetical protein
VQAEQAASRTRVAHLVEVTSAAFALRLARSACPLDADIDERQITSEVDPALGVPLDVLGIGIENSV